MKRRDKFLALGDDIYFSRSFKKLTVSDLAFCIQWIGTREHLDKNEYAIHVNRLFLDQEKPKNHSLIWELLSLLG